MGTLKSGTLLSNGLWTRVRKLPRAGRPVLAAIAYYSEDMLSLRQGDLLVIDASDELVRSGSTNGPLLLTLHEAGAAIHHLPGLHAKVVSIGKHAVVGSANASKNSEEKLTEAAVLTDDSRLRAQVIAFIKQVAQHAKLLEETELRRLAAIEVIRRPGRRGGRAVKISFDDPKSWWLSTGPLSDRLTQRERAEAERGMKEARAVVRDEDTNLDVIRWPARARVAKGARIGDRVIQAYSEPFGNEANTKVYGPATIVHIQKSDGSVRLYLESMYDSTTYVRIKTSQRATSKVGGRTLTARSARRLSDDEFDALDKLFEKPPRE